jgi:hypothetical protein
MRRHCSLVLTIASAFIWSVSLAELMPRLDVKGSWFFKGKLGNETEASNISSIPSIVKHGECFGFKVLFSPESQPVKVHVKLTVPESANRFTSHSGISHFSEDNKTVEVDYETTALNGSTSYYWGIDAEDPTGDYQLEFSLNGSKVDSYKFVVR